MMMMMYSAHSTVQWVYTECTASVQRVCGVMCADIDECSINVDLCAHGRCINYPGGYRCECDMGFTGTDKERTCVGQYVHVCVSSVPSCRRISGSAEFWSAAENPPKKIWLPKAPPKFRKSVSRRKKSG